MYVMIMWLLKHLSEPDKVYLRKEIISPWRIEETLDIMYEGYLLKNKWGFDETRVSRSKQENKEDGQK